MALSHFFIFRNTISLKAIPCFFSSRICTKTIFKLYKV